MKKYKQTVIPSISNTFIGKSPNEIHQEVKKNYQNNIQGRTITNKDLGIEIYFNKTGRDETVHFARKDSLIASASNILDVLLENAEFNNFGKPRASHQERFGAIGFLNFKSKCKIDGKLCFFRLSVMIIDLKMAKFQYAISKNYPAKIKMVSAT